MSANKETWRFIDSQYADAATNMAIDEAMIQLHSEGKIPPTIRFYCWDPATLSIGYFQQVDKEIDMEAVQKYGLGFVRRMTGGRAVLHDQELTYSVIVSENHPRIPHTVTEAYREISMGLLKGFQNLGLDAFFSTPSSHLEQEVLKNPRSAVCFDASSWYELVVEGRKVAGSAQTRQKGVVLQHGSILLNIDIDMLFDVFKFSSERVRDRMKQQFKQRAVAINELIDHPVTLSKVKQKFREGFEEALNIHLIEQSLTGEEEALVQKFVQEKYGNDEWNFRR